jgi:chromosome segregation ATPase
LKISSSNQRKISNSDLNKQLQISNKEIDHLKGEIKDMGENSNKLNAQLIISNKDLNSSKEEVNSLKRQLKDSKNEQDDSSKNMQKDYYSQLKISEEALKSIQAVVDRLRKQNDELNDQIKSVVEEGNRLKTQLLDSESNEECLNRQLMDSNDQIGQLNDKLETSFKNYNLKMQHHIEKEKNGLLSKHNDQISRLKIDLDNSKKEFDSLRLQNVKLDDTINNLKSNLHDLEEEADRLKSKLLESNSNIDILNSQLNQSNDQISSLNSKLIDSATEISDQQKKIKDLHMNSFRQNLKTKRNSICSQKFQRKPSKR